LFSFPQIRDQGVGGSNPLSPTNFHFKHFQNRRDPRISKRDLHWAGGPGRPRYAVSVSLKDDTN